MKARWRGKSLVCKKVTTWSYSQYAKDRISNDNFSKVLDTVNYATQDFSLTSNYRRAYFFCIAYLACQVRHSLKFYIDSDKKKSKKYQHKTKDRVVYFAMS